jgi:hypothetical protein
MLTRWTILVVFFATIALAGCIAPEPVLRLSPLSHEVVWSEGRAAQVKGNAVARVAVAFEREWTLANRPLVGFRVEIQNVSADPFLVVPSRFYYAVCSRPADGKGRACLPSHPAVNPEQVLLDLDMEHARKQAGAANEEALGGALFFLNLAAGMANVANGNRRGLGAAAAGAAVSSSIISSASAEGEAENANYESARSNWSDTALRKTTVLPGQGAAGIVFIDRQLDAREIVLAVRIDDKALDFPFEQIRYDQRWSSEGPPSRMTRTRP